MHTLKSVYETELALESMTDADIEFVKDNSEYTKDDIVNESQFNSYHTNPEYTKHTLILEAVRLYLTEIAPKRLRRKVKESEEMLSDARTVSTNAKRVSWGPAAKKYTIQQVGDAIVKNAEKYSGTNQVLVKQLGQALLNYTDTNLETLTPEEVKRIAKFVSINAKSADDLITGGISSLNSVEEGIVSSVAPPGMASAQTAPTAPASTSKPANTQANKAKPGMVKVKKNNDEKDVPATQLSNMRNQGYSVVGDEEVKEGTAMTPELAELMKRYGVEDGVEEGNEFSGALAAARAAGKDSFEVDGKTYNVKEGIVKSIKRGMAGWNADGKDAAGRPQKPKDVVARVRKSPDDEVKANAKNVSAAKGSPQGLQHGAAKQEARRRGLELDEAFRDAPLGDWGSSDWYPVMKGMDRYLEQHGTSPESIVAAAEEQAEFYHEQMGYDDLKDATDAIILTWMRRKGWSKMLGEKRDQLSKPNYAKLAKDHARSAEDAHRAGDMEDYTKHHDLSHYYHIKAGGKPPEHILNPKRFMKQMKHQYKVELAESISADAEFAHDSYQASMARSELYRNTKYAMDMLKLVRVDDEIQPWISANLTKAADYLDKIYHYLDYNNTFEPEQLPEDDMMQGNDTALGETTGSIARQNLMLIVEYSTKLFEMIQPKQQLEGWVAMKLTTASDLISSSKHYMEYVQFEKHASDMLGDVQSMAEEGSKMKKKPVRESVGQMLMSMMLNEDQDLAQAQTLLAAKAMSDDLQSMAEKIAKMSVEDLMPLVDTMKEQFGVEAAEGYNEVVKASLEELLDSISSAKDVSDNAILQLQSGGVPSAAGEEEPMPGVEPAAGEEGLPGEEGGEGLPEIPGEEGGEEEPTEPLGRALKEGRKPKSEAVTEKWDAKMKTKEKDKGKWDSWTLARLKAHLKKLMDKESRTAAEQKEVKQINFAIRAKQKDKWGDVKETKKAVKETKTVTEKAPPGKKAEEFIKDNKAKFKKQYGKRWEEVLYATAWKQFGAKSESYKKAVKMLESTQANRSQLESAFAAHKAQYRRQVNEGAVHDPLNMGYGLDGEIMMTQMSDLDKMISKLKEMISSEVRSGALNMIMSEQIDLQVNKLKTAKAAAPYGVMWKDSKGNKQSKFFESAQLRTYWVDLNKKSLNEQRMVEPTHFDQQIKKLLSKKG